MRSDRRDSGQLNTAIDGLDTKVSGATQHALYAAAQAHATERMLWFLRNIDFAAGLGSLVRRLRAGVGEIEKKRESLLSGEASATRDAAIAALIAEKVPADLAARIVDIPIASSALDATLVAERTKIDVAAAATTVFALAERFDLSGLRAGAQAIRATDPYERLALDRALAATDEAMRKIAAEVIGKHGAGEEGVTSWIAAKGESLVRTLKTIHALATGTLNQGKLTGLGGVLGTS